MGGSEKVQVRTGSHLVLGLAQHMLTLEGYSELATLECGRRTSPSAGNNVKIEQRSILHDQGRES
jgi:hypothetical protein